MKNRFEELLALHHNGDVLHIGNVWSAQSAKIYQSQTFKVIGTSSAAVADSLGFADGEGMSFDDYLFVIKRILAATNTILTVDLEFGYGNTAEEISSNITRLYELGVSGINIEDSVMTDGKRTITDANDFAEKLKQVTGLLNAAGVQMFINVRSDSFLLGLPNALEDALTRIAAYQQTGVHGLFFPCVTDIADIEKLTATSTLPINVMCVPGLPSFDQLQKAGVKRISAGPFVNMNVYKNLEATIAKIQSEGSFASLF
jgi:2-methylisocitrate lyase-like PEP mutase family enzyme